MPEPTQTGGTERAEVARAPGTRASRINDLVGFRVAALQKQFLAGSQSAQADLAKLRRAVGRRAGSVAEVWELTLEGVSPERYDSSPSAEEIAVHTAMGLYALHQRGNSAPMHVAGTGLGRAVARLSSPAIDSAELATNGVARRFGALATAVEMSEIEYHLRGLVTLLSGESVGLDYGRLAADLYRVQNPHAVDQVRLNWARDFYIRPEKPKTTTPTIENTETVKDAS
ncbi:type I-E CRISPR-associated protein Cse2/CasB [Jatrophihabitans lederbergiae]|uniref:Type I-E CRISPR-associated protein Cse2/CasB n=1 Tax=Jatrophihabitans lederbergiae TaxID=3075547 RepID=A0ABU2J726_9ACTN|nr:type I-E CRISPR-associated protein Cse2/CasB [Jatrophihabitans sp. DSM 44399]MDT0260063.1 type I-E CRISPR-associated protein Cse2/CasB [Jatrophihabitans sp. DSM 44399]